MTEQPTSPSQSYPWFSKSTAFTISLGVVTCVTGLMLFLKIGEQAIKGAHEWLSVVFVVAIVFHSIRHWNSMKRYVAVKPFWIMTLPVILVTALFIVPSFFGEGGEGHRSGPPGYSLLGQARIEHIAEISETSADVIIERLKSSGITVSGPQDTLNGLAESTNRRIPELLAIMTP